MYSRSYYPDSQERLSLPDNYDGTAFMERDVARENDCVQEISFGDTQGSETDTPVHKMIDERSDKGIFSSLGKSPLLSGIFAKNGLLGSMGLTMPNIGTEEILILATAAFLFFSKNGDRECALILLLLIFIN